MSITDSLSVGMEKILSTFADKYLASVDREGSPLVILTLVGLFVAWIVASELKDRRNEKRQDRKEADSRIRAKEIREKENDAKKEWGDNFTAIVTDLKRQLTAGFDKIEGRVIINGDRINDLDKRVTVIETRHILPKDPSTP